MVEWLGTAAPTPAPPANPTNPPKPTAMLRPKPQNVSVELEHLDVAAPIPAPAPAPAAPKIKALRRRWLLSSTVTRATFTLGMPMSFLAFAGLGRIVRSRVQHEVLRHRKVRGKWGIAGDG